MNAETPAGEAEPLPVSISPTDKAIRYIGRFEFGQNGVRCEWSASTIALRFRGTELNAKFKDGGQNRWQIEIDGKAEGVLQMEKGEHLYRAASGLSAGEHSVRLVRATEAFFGPCQIEGFQIAEGSLLPVTSAAHRIEVIGDSISCGYGNEAANQKEHFSAKTENAYFTYGAIAARALGADYSCIAWSGRKMWPDFTTPEIYDLIVPTEPGTKWDFSKAQPADVVLINLSTNDFSKANPEEAGWSGAYKQFVARLRKLYPQAMIYCVTSPMLGDWDHRKPLTVSRDYLRKIVADCNSAGDNKVRLIEFPTQEMKNGLGADWHPNVKTQTLMGEQFTQAIRAELHW